MFTKIALIISFLAIIGSTVLVNSHNLIEFRKSDDLYLEVLEAED